MFGKKKFLIDDETYKKSLRSKDANHRFYDQLASANRPYEETQISRFREKLEQRRRESIWKRTLKRIERRR